MNEVLQRLQEAAEYADLKMKQQPDHRLFVRIEVDRHGILIVTQLRNEYSSRITENRKLCTWSDVEYAHVNVLINRIDEMVAQMLGEKVVRLGVNR